MSEAEEIYEPYAITETHVDEVVDMRIVLGSFRCTLVSMQHVPGLPGDRQVAVGKIILRPETAKKAAIMALQVLATYAIQSVLGRTEPSEGREDKFSCISLN
jgi:hypothetical protein